MQRHSDIRRERMELLLCAERGNKADIHTYTSGHLGPFSFSPRPVHCQRCKPIWEKSKYPFKDTEISRLQESRGIEAKVEKMIDALKNFPMAPTLQDSEVLSSRGSPSSSLWFTPVDTYQKKELRDTTDLVLDGQAWRKQDLISRNRLSVREAVEGHKHKIQKGLRKVPVCRGLCRERLAVFSDVFNDVCDSSPAFGSILREIKTEYDLYLNSLMSSHSTLLNMSASMPAEVFSDTAELEEAAKCVSLLEEEARSALEENERARSEYEDAKGEVKVSMGNQLERDGKQSETEVSFMAQVEWRRQQVWRMWREVQSLQKEIRESMVSTVTTSSLMGFIKETEAEIMRVVASHEQLKNTNKDLEQNISRVLTKANVSEEIKKKVWEMIWNTVDQD